MGGLASAVKQCVGYGMVPRCFFLWIFCNVQVLAVHTFAELLIYFKMFISLPFSLFSED